MISKSAKEIVPKTEAEAEAAADSRTRRKKTWAGDNSFSMNSYIQKLARKALSIYPSGSVSADAVEVLDALATNVCDMCVDTACRATVAKRRKDHGNTITARAIQCGFSANVPDPVATPLQEYIRGAVNRYNASRAKDVAGPKQTQSVGMQRAERAGITFSVTRVERRMRGRTRGSVPHVAGDAAVALAAGLEFLILVIIKKSIEVAHSLDMSRLDSVHIAEAIKNSSGLAFEHLFKDVIVQNAGVQNVREAPRYAIPLATAKREPKREPKVEPEAEADASSEAESSEEEPPPVVFKKRKSGSKSSGKASKKAKKAKKK